jgi:hypothetical protein
MATGWGSIDGNNLLNAVGPAGFSITALPPFLTLNAGVITGNSATLTYTSFGGFAGTITQSCNVFYNGNGTPNDPPTCSFSTSTVTLPANGTVTSTITFNSTAPGGGAGSSFASTGNPPTSRDFPARTARTAIALGVLFLGLLPGRRRRLSLLRSLAIVAAIAVAFASLSGCGEKAAVSTGGSPGSSTGFYTITLTSSSGTTTATPAASIALTIQ